MEPLAEDRFLQYVSLGVNLGLEVSEPPGAENPICVVRIGHDFWELDLNDARVWASAASPVALSTIRDKARSIGVEDPDVLIKNLEDQGLLLRFQPDSEDWIRRLSHLRLQVQARSAGLQDPKTEAYSLISPMGEPLASVDAVLWTIWAMSDGRTIGEVCEAYATHVLDRPTNDVLRHVAHHLDALLSSGAAALDGAPATEDQGVVQ